MNRLYMIRHGKPATTWAEGGDPDPGLNAEGHVQAEAVAEVLMGLPADQRPTRVLSSPLRRCRETAQPFAERIGARLVVDARFGEIPSPAGLSAERRRSWLDAAFEGRWDDVRGDIDYLAWRATVAAAAAEQAGAAVFSHFVAINAAVTVAQGEDRVLAFRPDHTSVTVLKSEGGRLGLVALGKAAQTEVL